MSLHSAIIADSPISYWQLVAGSGADEMGANAGTPSNLTTGSVLFPGCAGSSVFNGTTSKLDLGTPASLKPPFPMSVEACFKTASGAQQRIYRWRDFGVWLETGPAADGHGSFSYQDSTTAVFSATGTTDLSTGGLAHHIVGTYDGANVRLYVDGALVGGPTAATTAINYTNAGAAIGTNGNDPTLWFNGSISDVAVYGTALTQTQVTTHYNQATNPTVGNQIIQVRSGLRLS